MNGRARPQADRIQWRKPACRALAVLALGLLLDSAAAAEELLFRGDPFDRIVLNAANDNAVLDVELLDLPDRKVPEKPRRDFKLVVQLRDKPEPAYELAWAAVDHVEFWEDMLLAEARRLASEGKLAEAYDAYEHLQTHYPSWPGLADAVSDYLMEEARSLAREKDFTGSLAVLHDLHERRPDMAGLDKAFGVTTDVLVKDYVAVSDRTSARAIVASLAALYPDHETVVAWKARFIQEAEQAKAEAETAMAAGDLAAAHSAARRMLDVWPELPGGRELFAAINQRHPRVVVGVSSLTPLGESRWLDDWAARRGSRLLHRLLMEYVAPGSEGGVYRCPMGESQYDPFQRRLTLQLHRDITWSNGEGALTGYDVARRLLEMADPRSPAYRAGWDALLGSCAVRDVFEVDLQLARPNVRPDAFLQTRLYPYTDAGVTDSAGVSIGPYVVRSASADEVVYAANPHYFAAGPSQPQEVVERRFADDRDALAALERGHVQIVDRVAPWQLARITENKRLALGTYGAPLVHCLIPNARKELTAHREMRRALLYGIDRKAILAFLSGNGDLPGMRVLSGPVLAGVSFQDPLSYAYDGTIEPRPYDPHLAIALANVALTAAGEAQAKRGKKLGPMPPLIVAHPPDAIARMACGEIQRQLGLLGMKIELVEREAVALAPVPDDVDLVYAQLALWEPVCDVPGLLADDGLAGSASPYMTLALRQLDEATNWDEVRERLRRIHRLASDDLPVIPLWQMVDYFAYDVAVQGIGKAPVTLFQDVEKWQITVPEPAP